tara:strand:- start:319 stop:678 length:360 start_codon:yes stop_codon:yes gene_type:complete
MKKKILCFDLDNVICTTPKNKAYKHAKPKKKIINLINKLYDSKKYIIKIFTARGMGKFKGNKAQVKKTYFKLTIAQLNTWKVRYHKLEMYKISYDFFVDDKAYGYHNKWYLDVKNKYLK